MGDTTTVPAAELTSAHTVVDADGMMYEISNIRPVGSQSIAFDYHHIYNGMLACRILDGSKTVRRWSRIRVLAHPDEQAMN